MVAALRAGVVVVVVVVVVVEGSSSSSKARPQAPGSFLRLEWFCWFFRVRGGGGGWGGGGGGGVGGWGGGGVGGWGGDVNVHTDAKMKTEQHLEMPTMMTMSMAMMHLMMI